MQRQSGFGRDVLAPVTYWEWLSGGGGEFDPQIGEPTVAAGRLLERNAERAARGGTHVQVTPERGFTTFPGAGDAGPAEAPNAPGATAVVAATAPPPAAPANLLWGVVIVISLIWIVRG